jgi:ankyrin repeat protein
MATVALPVVLFLTFVLGAGYNTNAQGSLRWVRGSGGTPSNSIVGGSDADGTPLYICRTARNGITITGKVVGTKCNYNWGNTEYTSGSYDILVGSGGYWSRRLNASTAVVAGGSDDETYYVCKAFTNDGTHPGRLQNGKCNYGYGGRGYAGSSFEVLNGVVREGDSSAAVSLLDSATRGDASGVRAALRAGQAINQKNSKGQTALMLAANKSANDVVRLLLNEGAAVDARDNEGFTALGYAAFQGDSQSARQLIRGGANTGARTESGNTPLYFAGASGDIDTVKLLIAEGARGLPLHGAAAYDRENVIGYLIDEEFDVDETDANGQTALMVAARGNKAAAVNALLSADADVSIRTSNNWEVFGLAAANSATDVMGVLLRSEKFGIKSPLVESGLRVAARDSKIPSISFLIGRGVNPDAVQKGVGTTPLMMAAANGHDGAVEALIKLRASLDLQNEKGETALILSAAAGKKSVVKALVRAGADKTITDNNGKTALQYATQNGHGDTRKELEKH